MPAHEILVTIVLASKEDCTNAIISISSPLDLSGSAFKGGYFALYDKHNFSCAGALIRVNWASTQYNMSKGFDQELAF